MVLLLLVHAPPAVSRRSIVEPDTFCWPVIALSANDFDETAIRIRTAKKQAFFIIFLFIN